MKNIKALLFVISLLSTLQANAQIYNPAKLILQNGDSLTGYVQRFREHIMSKEIYFSTHSNGENATKYLPDEIKLLNITEEKLYFEPVSYYYYKDSVKVYEKRLAKVMLKGFTNLYKLQLAEKEQNIILENDNTFVYILRKDAKDYVLGMTERIYYLSKPSINEAGRYYRNDKKYRFVLAALMSDVPKLRTQIMDLNFSDRAMYRIVTTYNNNQVERVPNISYISKAKVDQKWIVSTKSGVFFTQEADSTKISLMEIGFLYQINAPELNEKLKFQYGFYLGRIQNFNFLRFSVCSHYYTHNALLGGPFISFGSNVSIASRLPIVTPEIGIGYEKWNIQAKIMYENIYFVNHAFKIGVNYAF